MSKASIARAASKASRAASSAANYYPTWKTKYQTRGLTGMRDKDGSLLTNKATKTERIIIEEFGGDGSRYPVIDMDNIDEVKVELSKVREDIKKFEKGWEELNDSNYNEADEGPSNDFELGLVSRQLKILRKRENDLSEQMFDLSQQSIAENAPIKRSSDPF